MRRLLALALITSMVGCTWPEMSATPSKVPTSADSSVQSGGTPVPVMSEPAVPPLISTSLTRPDELSATALTETQAPILRASLVPSSTPGLSSTPTAAPPTPTQIVVTPPNPTLDVTPLGGTRYPLWLPSRLEFEILVQGLRLRKHAWITSNPDDVIARYTQGERVWVYCQLIWAEGGEEWASPNQCSEGGPWFAIRVDGDFDGDLDTYSRPVEGPVGQ